ncbi:hypothetical protein PPERSA_04892 [Pseudocohnilembus persalinus]|uniref:Transmembrane protein n=1 Tax=Pseudocohnilembus persalinus TaxID=266149 RepID=A0A0V0QJ76_PSEPJ|nr:hypothetical protein PPERSA_04892 [Pseudocohnilembus persalinus]|eukprot:KRX02270.1 hypothetical protein PPERSA_04892 [Pseudocohnilembus persalinus]
MVASNNGMEKNEKNEYYQKFMLLTIILSFTTTLVFKIKQLDFEICCSSLSLGFFGTICIIGYFVFIKGDYQNYFEYQFKEVENCKINNIELANFDDHEIFAAISVQIEIENQQYLTYACASNNLDSDSMWGKELKYSPVKFYGQAMPCGLHHKVLEVDLDIIQNQYYKNILEIQDIEYGKGHGHRQLQYVDNSYVKQCEFAQEFTKIKLPSWNNRQYQQNNDIEFENMYQEHQQE